MSQYLVRKGTVDYLYGYDRPLKEYFLTAVSRRGVRHIVGGPAGNGGGGVDLVEAAADLKVPLPEEHIRAALLDTPF